MAATKKKKHGRKENQESQNHLRKICVVPIFSLIIIIDNIDHVALMV
jgi:hypothetical protein